MSAPAHDELVGGSRHEPPERSPGGRALRVALLVAVLAVAGWLVVHDEDTTSPAAGPTPRPSAAEQGTAVAAPVLAGGTFPSSQPGPLGIDGFCVVERTSRELTVGVDITNGGLADLTVYEATATAALRELRPMRVELPAHRTCLGRRAGQAEVMQPGGGMSLRLTMLLPERCRLPAAYQVAVSFVGANETPMTQQLRLLTRTTPDTTDPCSGQ